MSDETAQQLSCDCKSTYDCNLLTKQSASALYALQKDRFRATPQEIIESALVEYAQKQGVLPKNAEGEPGFWSYRFALLFSGLSALALSTYRHEIPQVYALIVIPFIMVIPISFVALTRWLLRICHQRSVSHYAE